jgi:hypothetical protein
LEAAQVSELHERGRATAAEQELAMARSALIAELAMAWSALSTDQATLGGEWKARAFAEGQVQSKEYLIVQLEAMLTWKEEGLKIANDAIAGKLLLFSAPSILGSHPVTHNLLFVRVQS